MRNLPSAINFKNEIIRQIEDADGLLTEEVEAALDAASNEIAATAESLAFYRRNLKSDVEYLKSVLRSSIKIQETKLKSLDQFLLPHLERIGKIKTPLCSMSVTTKKTEKVIVDDFDTVLSKYPEAVQVSTDLEKGERVFKVMKKELLASYKEGRNPIGWHIELNETKFINQRIKGD